MNGTCKRIDVHNMHQIIETVPLINNSLATLNLTTMEINATESKVAYLSETPVMFFKESYWILLRS